MEPEHAPPPPYSETDIYSNAGTSPHPLLTPSTSQADNASVATRPLPSTASSVDETVYTPLYSPAGSVNQTQVFGDDYDHVSSSSATAYFESRPAHRQSSAASPEIVTISVTSQTEPKDLPYPQALLAKDVSDQDWATFVNYLLPDHVAGVNNDVADRKLKAELIDERMHRLTLGKESRSMTDLREVDAQLDPLRQSQSLQGTRRLEATISEWNDGFFKPRGIQISISNADAEIAPDEEAARLPGSYIPWEHEMNPESAGSSSSNVNARKGFFSGFMQAGPQGFKMGPIVADNDGFRIGKNGLRADNNGFRLGNMLVADSTGFRLGGSRGFNADGTGVSLGGRSWGRRECHDSETDRGRHGHRGHRGRSHPHGRHHRRRGRSSSASSDSSSSSSSSSESDASVGSLPDYEDLKDQQLPVVKQSLMEWLDHPDQPITKEYVSDLRQDIHYAKDNVSQQKGQDLYALRKEVKDLTKLFKDAKRAQRKERKDARRQRRAVRKALRKERRTLRKEERKAKKQDKRCGPRGGARTGPPWMGNRMPGSWISGPPGLSPQPDPSCIPPIASSSSSSMNPPPMPGFPFGRSASAPFMKGMAFGRGGHMPPMPPGIAALHSGWPFSHNSSYSPGGVSAPPIPGFPVPTTDSAEKLHDQALQFEKSAELKESKAIDLRTAATGINVSEKEKLKMRDEATKLEEEAEKYRREVDRLRAEAMHLDGEMARELQEDHANNGQASGVIPGAYVQ